MCGRDDDPTTYDVSFWLAAWTATARWSTTRSMRRYAVREWWLR